MERRNRICERVKYLAEEKNDLCKYHHVTVTFRMNPPDRFEPYIFFCKKNAFPPSPIHPKLRLAKYLSHRLTLWSFCFISHECNFFFRLHLVRWLLSVTLSYHIRHILFLVINRNVSLHSQT